MRAACLRRGFGGFGWREELPGGGWAAGKRKGPASGRRCARLFTARLKPCPDTVVRSERFPSLGCAATSNARRKEEGFFDCASRPEIERARFPGKKKPAGRSAQNDNERRRRGQCAHLKGGRYKGEEGAPPSQNEDGAPGKSKAEAKRRGILRCAQNDNLKNGKWVSLNFGSLCHDRENSD